MTDELMVINTGTDSVELSPQIIRKYIARGGGQISDQEAMLFMNLCKFGGLNPFMNEAYLIKFGSQPAQMVVGKDAFLKKANSNPRFKGLRAGIIVKRESEVIEIEGSCYLDTDKIAGGWAEIHIENRIPFKHSVTMREYVGRKKDGSINSMWKDKPATMIRKVAIAQALRESLPETLQNMYTEEEMNVENINIETIDTKQVEVLDNEVVDLSEGEEIDFVVEPEFDLEGDIVDSK